MEIREAHESNMAFFFGALCLLEQILVTARSNRAANIGADMRLRNFTHLHTTYYGPYGVLT